MIERVAAARGNGSGYGENAAFLHLGHPMRAWRAIAIWRTSWLSREVIVLPATIGVVAWWSAAQLLSWPGAACIAAAGVVLCFALWGCTGMVRFHQRFQGIA